MNVRRLVPCFAVFLALTGAAQDFAAVAVPPEAYSALRWRLAGPLRGGWATSAVGVPGKPDTFYMGTADGGVWTTTDAGRTWSSLFDHEGAASVGALALAPSDPAVLYVGTGQAVSYTHLTLPSTAPATAAKPGSTGASPTAITSAACGSIRATPTWCSPPPRGISSAPTPSAASSAPPTAARPGTARCSWTRTRAARTWEWTRPIPAFCLPACGRSKSTRGDARVAATAA